MQLRRVRRRCRADHQAERTGSGTPLRRMIAMLMARGRRRGRHGFGAAQIRCARRDTLQLCEKHRCGNEYDQFCARHRAPSLKRITRIPTGAFVVGFC